MKKLMLAIVLTGNLFSEGNAHDYHYSSLKFADPFAPPSDLGNGNIGTDKIKIYSSRPGDTTMLEIAITGPLQKYPLNHLRVIGTWQSTDQVWKSLILSRDQKTYVAREGDPIGQQGGIITEIGENYVKLKEFDLLSLGLKSFVERKLVLDPTLMVTKGNLSETLSTRGSP